MSPIAAILFWFLSLLGLQNPMCMNDLDLREPGQCVTDQGPQRSTPPPPPPEDDSKTFDPSYDNASTISNGF